MNNLPLVSVIIPAYNCSDTISTSVLSALYQGYKNLEVVIVDDSSTDNTSEVIRNISVRESRIIFLSLEQNSGPAVARNKGLEKAHGELIAFLDADDEWMPGKISRQVELFQRHPDMDLLFTEVSNTDYKTGKNKPYSMINKLFLRNLELNTDKRDRNLYKVSGQVKRELYSGNFICLSSVLVRRATIDRVNGFNVNRFGTEDVDFWIRLSDKVNFYYLDETTTQYNWLPNSISRINQNRLHELLRYYKESLNSVDYSDLFDITYHNLYLTYKTMILEYSVKWDVLKAFETLIASLEYPIRRNLWIYALSSLLGPLPILFKTQIYNPLSGKMKTNNG